jgi:hypothetical protein
VTVLTFRFTLVPAIAVAVEGSTTKVKSWVGRTMKYPEEVAVPPEVLTWRGPVTPPVGTVTLRSVRSAMLLPSCLSAACEKSIQNPSLRHTF